jgi:glycosyltransferase involved in cell wall biosynthesis
VFVVNGRYLGRRLTGVERYAQEVVKRFHFLPQVISPSKLLKGVSGHIWEQAVLPLMVKNHLLWSPCNIGPVSVKEQIVTLHDVIVLDHPEWFHPHFVQVYRHLLPRLVKKARHILTVSHYSKERILDHFQLKDADVTVIPDGVGEEFHPRPVPEVLEVKTRYGIADRPYLLILASRDARKNHAGVLRAWKKLMEKRDDVWLVVAGDIGESGNFRRSHADPNIKNVIQTKYVAEACLPALYSGASGFLFPSLYEGFGLPVLEALACGTPVITSNSTSLPELRGGRMILVDPLCTNGIVDAIIELLEDPLPRHAVSKVCADHARQFSWYKTAAQIEAILLRYSS